MLAQSSARLLVWTLLVWTLLCLDFGLDPVLDFIDVDSVLAFVWVFGLASLGL